MIFVRKNGKKSRITKNEKGNQQGTTLINKLLNSVRDVLRIGFQHIPVDKKWTFYHHATSVNKIAAIKGVYPKREIDFTKVVFSVGDLPAPINAEVKIVNNQLEFTWKADTETMGSNKRDQIMLIAYFPKKYKSIYLLSGARRTEEVEFLQLPRYTKDMVIETYIAYVSDDRKQVSDSVYTGQLIWNKL